MFCAFFCALMMQDETEERIVRPRYFLHISYDGTNYCGWQFQANGNTVQAEIEKALRRLLRQEKVVTVGCGRTDAGVHAKNFYLHFEAEKEIDDQDMLFFKLNQLLPWDIAVHNILRVADKAHARFDATERTYEYHVHQRRNPFTHLYSKFFPFPLDVEIMNEAAQMLLDYNDFSSFQRTGGGQSTSICYVRRATWERTGHQLKFTISANRFLRNMVRAIVGTHFIIGKGRMTLDEYKTVIESKNRMMAGDSIKAAGLHLVQVKYPFINESI